MTDSCLQDYFLADSLKTREYNEELIKKMA